MKMYLAKCSTVDQEAEYPETNVEILGIFSTPKLAEEAFTRKEIRYSEFGQYPIYHQCFRGTHEVEEYELDGWRKGAKLILSYWLSRHGEIERVYRIK